MKKILFFIIAFVFSLTLCGCTQQTYLDGSFAVVYENGIPYLINKNLETYALDRYDEIVPEFGEYLIVSNGVGDKRKYGFIKNTGEEIIKPKYQSATMFSEDKAIVSLDNQLYIINPNDEILCVLGQDVHSSKLYSEGFLVVETNGKYTYLNSNFEFAATSFDYASSFVNGYAVVGNFIDNELRYGLIDKNFNIVISLEHDFLDNYSNGFVRVGTIINQKENVYEYKFMRLDGTFLTDEAGEVITTDYALNFSSGVALIADYVDDPEFGIYKVYKYIDTEGKEPFIFSFNRSGEGLYYFDNLIESGDTNTLVGRFRMRASGAGDWAVLGLYDGYLDRISFTIPEEFENNKNVLFYKTPYEMTNFKFSTGYGTSSPLARVRIYTGEYGIVDSTATYIIPAKYEFLFY